MREKIQMIRHRIRKKSDAVFLHLWVRKNNTKTATITLRKHERVMQLAKYDWKLIETEYLASNISQAKLAEKYGIPLSTMQSRAKKYGWSDRRKEIHQKSIQKACEKIEKSMIERLSSILCSLDKLAAVIDKALDDDGMFYKVLVEDKQTGGVRTKKTKVLNTKRLKEMSDAIRNVSEIYGAAEERDRRNKEAGSENELTVKVVPFADASGKKADVSEFDEYGG